MTRQFRFILAVALLAATGSAAQADSYVKFYGDNHNYSGAFSSGAVYNTLLGTSTATCGAGSTNCTVTSGVSFWVPSFFPVRGSPQAAPDRSGGI